MENDNYLIVSIAKDKNIAKSIASNLDINYGDIFIKKTNISETSIEIDCYVENKDIFLIYNISQPINENIINLLFAVDELKKKGANKIFLFTNYLPYTKLKYESDRNINFNLFVRLLDEVKIDAIYTFDLYTPQIINAFKIPIYDISLKRIFYELFEEKFAKSTDLIITTIEYETEAKAKDLAKIINAQFLSSHKKINNNHEIAYELKEKINGKDAIILTDVINSGNQVMALAKYLTFKSIENIYVISTNAQITEESSKLLEDSVIKEIYVANCDNKFKSKKITIIPTYKITQEIIQRVIEKKNVVNFIK
ncbi:MAG: ribose-phosphate diphosphokinase [archaeon]